MVTSINGRNDDAQLWLRILGRAVGLGIAVVAWGVAVPSVSQPQADFPHGTTLDQSQGALALERLIQNTTVRVYAGTTAGSGVIVARSGSHYQVLTNRHVVDWGDRLQILTVDRQFHPGTTVQTLAGLDLALVTFQSDRPYAIAPLSPSLPSVGTPLYAAGFPLYQPSHAQDTTALGRQVFQITQGQLAWILTDPLPEGYSLGYGNPVAIGMSGGPVFDPWGQVVGINGRSGGRDAGFGLGVLANGQVLAPALVEQMAALSWGIAVAGGVPGLAIAPGAGSARSPMPAPPLPAPRAAPTAINPPQVDRSRWFQPQPKPEIDGQPCLPTAPTCADWTWGDPLPSPAPANPASSVNSLTE